MSAGPFIRSLYTDDTGAIHPIRIQPETLTLTLGGETNSAPTGPANARVSAQVSGGTRQLGLNARKVRFEWDGTPPTDYDPNGVLELPWLDPLTFAGIVRGAAGTYLGANVVAIGKTAETAN